MKMSSCVAVAIALSAGSAFATTFNARFESVHGRGGFTVTSTSTNTVLFTGAGGHMQHRYADGLGNLPASGSTSGAATGQFVGGPGSKFRTFCIELQGISGADQQFEIVDLATAPTPGSSNPNGTGPYGSARASEIHRVVRYAIDNNWVNYDLSRDVNAGWTDAQYLDRMAALQGAIWSVLFDGSATVVNSNATVQQLMNNALTWDPQGGNYHVAGLRAMVSGNAQDQLYVVPLPPAAFAGLATLVGVAGVARLRRR